MNNKKYVIDKILNTDVSEEPWKHLVIEDFLPDSLFNGIKKECSVFLKHANFKPNDKFDDTGLEARGYALNVNKSQKIWPVKNTNLDEYYTILSDIDVEKTIKSKVNLKKYHSPNLSVDMWSSFDVQLPGFVYDDIHTDHPSKIHTLIHYLADEDDDLELGTTLYSPDKEGKKMSVTKDFIKRVNFKPNTAVLFSPCTKKGFLTNHCMFHLSKKTFFRKSIQTFWLKNKENWKNVLKTAKKLN